MGSTTGTIQGHVMALYMGGEDLTRIAAIKNVSFDLSANMVDNNNVDTGDYDVVAPGRRRWSASGSGHFQFDAGYGIEDLFDAWKAKTMVYCLFSDDNDDIKYFGKGYIESLKTSFPDHENSTYDFTINGGASDMEKLDSANESELITGWTNDDFNTFQSSGTNITSAIDTGDGAANTNTFALAVDDILKFVWDLTVNSGVVPTLKLTDGSNETIIILAAGEDFSYVAVPVAGTYHLEISVAAAADFALDASLLKINL